MSTDDPRPARPGRRGRAMAGLGLVGLTLWVSWRSTTLGGLPDVGDPFDVAAFDAPVPDDRNAFVLYRQAAAKMIRTPPGLPEAWRQAPPEVVAEHEQVWLDANREALALWRRGTERPDALYIRPGSLTFYTVLDVSQQLREFARLAFLEAARREEAGDLAGALDWYLAALRSSRHVGRRGTIVERVIGVLIHNQASRRLDRWAADPRVDASLLRRALDAAVAADAMTGPVSDMLKCEYMACINTLADPRSVHPSELAEPAPKPWISKGFRNSRDAASRIVLREPERSRRVVRLVYANWLAHCDRPAGLRPPKVAASPTDETLLLLDLYETDPGSPPPLPPEELARWHRSTIYARMLLPILDAVMKAIARERGVQANLLVRLADEIYRREHGDYPERVEDLVGPYLKALPEGDRPAAGSPPISPPPAAGTGPGPRPRR